MLLRAHDTAQGLFNHGYEFAIAELIQKMNNPMNYDSLLCSAYG
jgi:hypothetical protein